MSEFRLNVNGAKRTVSCEPDTPLLEVLPDSLGLSGPKYGCGIGVCGACSVLVDGRACARVAHLLSTSVASKRPGPLVQVAPIRCMG